MQPKLQSDTNFHKQSPTGMKAQVTMHSLIFNAFLVIVQTGGVMK